MKKHLQEEKIDLKAGLSKSFLLVIILSDFLFPQIPFKGFCKLTTLKVDSGYTRIFSFNYDKDEYADLLIYNPIESKALLFRGTSGLHFEKSREIHFPLQPSKIEPIITKNNMVEGFAFTSRKNRAFGVCKFNTRGNPELLHKINFDSYPENISVADINDDGKPEFLLSGNSFNGLSIIKFNGNKLVEDKVLQNQSFANAQFVDLNSDDIKDIVVLNTINNTIQLLYNNGRSEFTELRKIFVNDNVLTLRIFDINYDSFPDIIISTESSIKIYFGDPTHSYENTATIQTPSSVNDFVIGDFNRDGYFDFNCLTKSDGKIFTIFAKDFNNFYTPLIHLKKDGIVDLIPFFSKFVYGSAFINVNGEVNILSKIISLSDEQSLAMGVKPETISKFDLTDNGIVDLMFTNEYNQSINFVLRDASGYPDKLFSVPLNEDYKNIIVFNNSKLLKTFYFFTYGKRIIESLELDFHNFKSTKNLFYSSGEIESMVVNPDNSGNAEVYVLNSKDGKLNLEIFSKTSLKYSKKSYTDITSSWFSPAIISTKNLQVGYWNYRNQSVNLNLVDLSSNMHKTTVKNRLNKGNYSIVSESNPSSGLDNVSCFSFISNKDEIIVLDVNNDFNMYKQNSNENDLRITDKNQLFFDKNYTIFANDNSNKDFYKIRMAKSKHRLVIDKLFSNINISNFTIAKLDHRNINLIYTDDNQIKIKQLPND